MKTKVIKSIIITLFISLFFTFQPTNFITNNYTQTVDASTKKTVIVYVTNTGTKYHMSSCKYLKKSKIAMELSKAKKSYDPCTVCKPPK